MQNTPSTPLKGQGHYLCGHLKANISSLQDNGELVTLIFLNFFFPSQITLLTMHCNSFGQFQKTTIPGLQKHTMLVDHYLWDMESHP